MKIDDLEFLETARRMPLVELPIRTTIATLGSARVLLSPASTLSVERLRAAGKISDIVAPSLFHTEGMLAAAEVHPNARLWGPVGIREKRPELVWHGILGQDDWPHERELAHVALAGMPGVNESVFLHHRAQTLLVTDLVFNIEQPRGVGAWLLFRAFGTYRRLGVSRFFTAMVKDRAAFLASVAQLAALEFDRLVPAHGAIVPSGGKEKLLAALRARGYVAPADPSLSVQ